MSRKGRARFVSGKFSYMFIAIVTLLPAVLGACGEATVGSQTPVINRITATPVATTAPIPTPTPEIAPNKLLLGSEANTWGEITRYEAGTGDKLEDISLTAENRESLSSLFVAAPALASVGGTVAPNLKSGTYTLSFKPEVTKGLQDGSLKFMNSLEGGIRPVVVDSKGVIRGVATLKTVSGIAVLANPATAVFGILSVIAASDYMSDINKQLETISKNVSDIKEFLEADKRSQLEGDLKYLNDIGALLNQQKITPADVESFRTQLETVERETLQLASLEKSLMEKTDKAFAEVKLDKKLFVFRNEDKIDELKKLLTDHKRQADSYLNALMVRGLASQIRCALPESRSIALTRLEDVRKELVSWNDAQAKFYSIVELRVPQMDGLFSDDKTRTQFLSEAKAGKQVASQDYTQLDKTFDNTIQKVKAQIDAFSQALGVVVTLDDNGKVVKTSKLVGFGK